MRNLVCAGVLVLLPAFSSAQEKTVPVPASVKVEGMPPIPQSIADDFARYTQYRSAIMQAWHPTKRQILISTTLGVAPQLYLVDGPGRDRHQLTWVGGAGVSPALSSPSFDPADGNTFVFMGDPAGSEAGSIYRYDLATEHATLAVSAKIRYTPLWLRTGKWLVYDSNERNGTDKDLYVVDPRDPKTKRRIAEFTGLWSPHDSSPDGKFIVANEIVTNNESYLWVINVQTGEKRALTPRDGEKAFWQNARFSSDGRKVYAISEHNGGDWRIWRCEIASCKWAPVTPQGVFIDSPFAGGAKFDISPDGSTMAVIVDKGEFTELQLLDLTTLKMKLVQGLPRGVISQPRWRPGSREVAVGVASSTSPGDVYSVDASLGTVTRWTTSETTFHPDALPPPELVQWKSPDGVPVSAILYRPAAKFTGPRPVLVSFHGGPDQQDRVRFLGRTNYFLNELGVAFLCPNVRGSEGYGRKFRDMDNGRGRDGVLEDVGAMLDWIGTRPDLDASRVVLSGGSYGGWLALEGGVVYNGRIRGIIEGAGITDFVTFLEQQDPSRLARGREEYGDERDPQMREYLESISPVTRASELKKPTLILHPGKDSRVPVAQAQELVAALKANNAPVWYLEFANANHDNFPGTLQNVDYMLESWILFFKQFVLD